jgi:gas vesicle protein
VRNENESKNTLSDKNGPGPSVSAFVMGLGVGAALGMLFAPRSGADTRNYISASAKDGLDGAVAAGQKLTRRAKQRVNRAKDRVNHAREVGEQAYQDANNSSSE